ncbi:hypothetical protein [Dietzia sp. WMMA184]|uniref:hypothetical protein n=1 Tax=Dietzia sp. WMMA184 TaxID=2039808 RepID=UPI00352C06E9
MSIAQTTAGPLRAAAIRKGITGLLLLPASVAPGGGTGVIEAFFTATSAMCLTGLIVVDTAVHRSGFGQLVILGLIQVGGLGIMTMASLVGLLLANRIGLKARPGTAAEAWAADLGDVRGICLVGIRDRRLMLDKGASRASWQWTRQSSGRKRKPWRAVSSTESVMHLIETVRNPAKVNDAAEVVSQPSQDAVLDQLAVGDVARERAT